jgi:hypothetical protein
MAIACQTPNRDLLGSLAELEAHETMSTMQATQIDFILAFLIGKASWVRRGDNVF